ncbi:hypothetical protein V8D89_013854 [Ganoderma adspersum]
MYPTDSPFAHPDPNPYIKTPSVPIHTYGAPPSPAPAPAPPKEKRHKSRSRRHHDPPPQQYPLPGYAAPPRDEENEKLLTEVCVPLRPTDAATGMWVDAQDVSEELQKGPSRIDGRAKVYTLRGKYKQYFLRTSEDGAHVCQPANLKVTPERTLEMLFIEDSPLPPGQYYPHHWLRTPHSPPRDLLTPSTDQRSMTMTSPSPAPASASSSSLQLQIGIPKPTPTGREEKRPRDQDVKSLCFPPIALSPTYRSSETGQKQETISS